MLELMTWSEIIESLRLEGGFKMAVVFDLDAAKLAETDGAMLTEEDATIIKKCMDAYTTMIYGLFLAGTKFSCMNVDPNTLIGRAENDVFVAHRNGNMLICVVSALTEDSSCLKTVKNFVGRLMADGSPDVLLPSVI